MTTIIEAGTLTNHFQTLADVCIGGSFVYKNLLYTKLDAQGNCSRPICQSGKLFKFSLDTVVVEVMG